MLSPTHGLTFVSDWSTPKGMADRNHCNLLCLFNCSLSQAQCSRISAMNNENDEMHVLFFPALWMLALSLFAGWWFQRRRHLQPPIDNLRSDALRDPSPTQWDVVRFTFSVDLCSVCWLQNWVGREISNVVTRYNFSSASSIKSKWSKGATWRFFQVSNAQNLFTPTASVHGENLWKSFRCLGLFGRCCVFWGSKAFLFACSGG